MFIIYYSPIGLILLYIYISSTIFPDALHLTLDAVRTQSGRWSVKAFFFPGQKKNFS